MAEPTAITLTITAMEEASAEDRAALREAYESSDEVRITFNDGSEYVIRLIADNGDDSYDARGVRRIRQEG